MKNRYFYSLVIFGLFIVHSPALSQTTASDRQIVAHVDTAAISAGELRDFVHGIPLGLRSKNSAGKAREAYLRSLIGRYLLELEAYNRGLDTSSAFQAQVASRWQQRLIEVYRRDHLKAQVEVSEEEIRRYFQEHKSGRQRQLSGILVHERHQAQDVLKRLGAGESFQELAQEYSVEPHSGARGGEWGFITLSEARRLKIPDQIFHTLPLDTLSDILPIGDRFLVMRFLQDRPPNLDEQRSQIRMLLHRQKRDELEVQKIDSLARVLGSKLEPKALDLLLEKAEVHAMVKRGQLSPQEAAQPLFSFAGGQVTLGDYVDALWEDPLRASSGWGIRNRVEVEEIARTKLLSQAMLAELARQAGIPAQPEQLGWLEKERRKYMVNQLRQTEVVDKLVVTGEEARDYYQKHQETFRHPEEFYIDEVLVHTEAVTSQLLAELETGGESLSSMASIYSIRPGMKQELGRWHVHSHERFSQPQLYKAVQEADLNHIVGPVQVEGGYSLFKVVDRSGGQIQPFSEAETRARGLVRLQKKNQLFEQLVDELMAEYQGHITVYPNELEAALPDSLLQRLAAESEEGQ